MTFVMQWLGPIGPGKKMRAIFKKKKKLSKSTHCTAVFLKEFLFVSRLEEVKVVTRFL